jgi:hypothetical protein
MYLLVELRPEERAAKPEGKQVRHVVQRGRWLYDGQAQALVEIFTEPMEPPESPEDPPRDAEGNTFYVEYSVLNGGKSQSWYYASVDEAVAEAERAVGTIAITWDAFERP